MRTADGINQKVAFAPVKNPHLHRKTPVGGARAIKEHNISNHMTPQQQDRCREMYLGGIPEEQVARALGVNTYEVRAAVREQPRRGRQVQSPKKRFPTWTSNEEQTLIKMYRAGKTAEQIAQVVGHTAAAVSARRARLTHFGVCFPDARKRPRTTMPMRDLATGIVYPSAKEAAEAVGVSSNRVAHIAKNGGATQDGHTFQYV